MTWTRTELEDAFAGYQNTVVECTRSGDWNAFADMFTEDVVYVEHAFGTLNGREAVRKWVTRTMTEFPGQSLHYTNTCNALSVLAASQFRSSL